MKYGKIENNTVVQVQPYHQEGFEQVPDNTIPGMIRDGGGFINPPIPLMKRREKQREVLKASRDAIIAEPINNVQVGRLQDRENIKDSIRKWSTLGNPATITWILADNTTRDMSKADLQAIEDQYAIRQMQTFQRYQELLTDLANADNPEDIIWTSGE